MITLDLQEIQRRLETKQAELRAHIIVFSDSPSSSGSDDEYQSLEDEAEKTSEMERGFSVQANERALFAAVHAALRRLREGTYGNCVDCGQPIPAKRLNALPWAARDIACEVLWEKGAISGIPERGQR